MQTPPFAHHQRAHIWDDLQFVRENLPRVSPRNIAIAHRLTLAELTTSPTEQTIDDLVECYETMHTVAELLGQHIIELHTLRHIARKLRREYQTRPVVAITADDFDRLMAGADLIDDLTRLGTDTLMMFAAVETSRQGVQ